MRQARQNSPLLAPYGGDMGLAALAMRKQEDARDFAAGRSDAAFNQGIRTQQEARAEKQAQEKPQYMKDDNGNIIEILPYGKGARAITPEGATQNNPFMSGGKMNESQSKDALYASRMMASEKVLRTIDADVATDRVQKALGTVSDKIGYNLRSPEFQKFDQAQRDFINATLRRESGAVISDAEFANARQQYFPQPGEGEAILKQKRANRMEAIRGIGAGAGQGYRPDSKFDEKGEIVDNPRPAKAASSLPKVNTPAEAAKLPKGTRFVDPNGVERIVP
jgi:hypothetical protein